MIQNDRELQTTQERLRHFQLQLAHLRQAERNPENYRHSAAGYLAELDRMNLELREYFESHPSELAHSVRA